MSTTAIIATGYQTLPLSMLHESSTNPRRTFEPRKLVELAERLRTHGLIQPITVRPNNEGFEIVAGARRFRAAQIAELAELPVCILDLTDEQTLEIQIIENTQRQDVHPYEEAAGYQRLLDLPGYDVAALAGKCGKSQSHIYARLALLQLVPEVAEAFQQEKITASHANLIARLPQSSQAAAFEQCWRKEYGQPEPHLLPAKHLAAWITSHLYLALEDAPFDREDPTLSPEAGACITCPRRTGYNTTLFADVADQGDQCLDSGCYHNKITAHLHRQIAARPELVQIVNGYSSTQEQWPQAVRRGVFHEIDAPAENPDAEPAPPCATAKPAIIVCGRFVGTTFTVCTDNNCPVHDPLAARKRQAQNPMPTVTPATPAPKAESEKERKEQQKEQERRAEEQRLESERRQQEYEAERTRKEKLQKARSARFDRIIENAPAMFSATQLRAFLRALTSLDPYTFADDVAEFFDTDEQANQLTAEEILLSALAKLKDDQLTGFALRLVLTGHTPIQNENEIDFLAEAEAAFVPPPQKKATSNSSVKKPAKATAKALPKQTAKAATSAKSTAKKPTAKPAKA